MSASFSETQVAAVSVLPGLFVAIALAAGSTYFVANAAFYWGSQIAVLAISFLLKPRPITIAGAAIALAVYLAAFGGWLFTRTHAEALAWFGYVLSLPGALFGIWAACTLLRHRSGLGLFAAAILSFGVVSACLAVNQAVVCSTVIYCGGR